MLYRPRLDMNDLKIIDGSLGEGGGQVLRTSLALSMITGFPFRIINIRAGRRNPGLRNQHVTSVSAATAVSGGRVDGNTIGSTELTFTPQAIRPGKYQFSVGTAGSCTLVLQTVLPALLCARSRSRLTLEGGTHNPFAPPFDFLSRVFLPLLNRMGSDVSAGLVQPGFYPAGGGRIDVDIGPTDALTRIDILERGQVRRVAARALVARLPRHIAERELGVIKKELSITSANLHVDEISKSPGPGNAVFIEIESEQITEVFTAFGERGVSAEDVAGQAVREAREYLSAGVPVSRHLADQLLLPMSMAGGGAFRTLAPTKHFTTNIEVIRRFLPVDVSCTETTADTRQVEIRHVS
jgi:RNA 3'-terminal phosphate cyclase (ATP)